VVASVLQARELGYEVFVVVDACGDVSPRAHDLAIQRLLQERAVPMTWLQMFLAFHHDWAPREAYQVLFDIVRNHARAYGLKIQYERTDLSEGKTRLVNNKTKERWWRKCSMVPVRSLKRYQERP
jgi:hypothetical protein